MHRAVLLVLGLVLPVVIMPFIARAQHHVEQVEPQGETGEDPSPSAGTSALESDQPEIDTPSEPEPPGSDQGSSASAAEEAEEQAEGAAPTAGTEPEASSGEPEAEAGESDEPTRPQVERVMTTVENEAEPSFIFWQSERFHSFIKPMVQLSSSVVGYFPNSSTNEELSPRASTLLLARLGLEGQLFRYVTFRIGFERNIGFSLTRNGPVGTGVWEGTASMQSLENYVQLSRWGVSLTGGIFLDPASLDYVSENVLDMLGKDPYIREPLLMSGMNQGQGVRLAYSRWGMTIAFSYTGGNPLISSLAYGFGGDVTASGTLYRAPLRDWTLGFPGSNIHMNVLSPSISFENRFIGIRAAAQFYFVEPDVTIEDDLSLFGYNFRGSLQVVLLDGMLRFFAGGSYRQNQQLDIPDLTTYRTEAYRGWTVSGGFDFSFGGNYDLVWSAPNSDNRTATHYINLGATYWVVRPYVSIGLRWGRSMERQERETGDPPTVDESSFDSDSAILSLRLLI